MTEKDEKDNADERPKDWAMELMKWDNTKPYEGAQGR